MLVWVSTKMIQCHHIGYVPYVPQLWVVTGRWCVNWTENTSLPERRQNCLLCVDDVVCRLSLAPGTRISVICSLLFPCFFWCLKRPSSAFGCYGINMQSLVMFCTADLQHAAIGNYNAHINLLWEPWSIRNLQSSTSFQLMHYILGSMHISVLVTRSQL